jgi:adenylate kinase
MSISQLILLGAPGSGKGTQAAKLVSELGYNHLSTGDLLRAEIAEGTELGKRVQGIMERGELVDDGIVLELLKKNCDLESNKYIFDGFPRNIEQAKALSEVVLKDASYQAIYFELDLEVIVDRISNRRMAPKSGRIYNLISSPPKVEGKCDETGEDLIQRKDDNVETVRNRLEVFKETIGPVIEFYKNKNALQSVNAISDPEDVFAELGRKLS